MNVSELIGLLEEENKKNTISVYCPSVNTIVELAPLLIGTYKSILVSYYNAVEQNNMTLFDIDLNNILSKLIINRNMFDINELNPIDKINLLLHLKRNNENKTKINITCINEECGIKYTIDKLLVSDESLQSTSYYNHHVDILNKKFTFKLKIPSILKDMEYENFLNQRLNAMSEQYEKDLLLEYSENFEHFIPYVYSIVIDDIEVSGYYEMSIQDKIKLFDKFGDIVLDENVINNLTINASKHLIYNVKCPKCDTVNQNMIEPIDFMI